MYKPIQMSYPKRPPNVSTMFELFQESASASVDPDVTLFNEAVFSGGKEKLTPLVEQVKVIKDILEKELTAQDSSMTEIKKNSKDPKKVDYSKAKRFNPTAFWRNAAFKELEDRVRNIFGFRHVEICPYIERYNSADKTFESKIMNCEIYHMDRFPVDGLVTDNGFYDKSHSLTMQIYASLGLLRALTPEEFIAVLLHEFGHGIDPALVSIKFVETNILSKYLTDRRKDLNKNEKKLMRAKRFQEGIIFIPAVLALGIIGFSALISKIKNLLMGKKRVEEQRLEKIRKLVEEDKTEFTRQNYNEAFADNFARMYGYGPQLASGLKKMAKEMDDRLHSRIKKEEARQAAIAYITEKMLKDEHRTEIHRIRALLKEYQMDIDDPNTSPTVKKQLQEDKAELEKVLNEYLNNFSDFQNRVNQVINEELEKIDATKKQEPMDPKKKEEAIKEGYELFEESKKGWEKLMKAIKAPTPEDQAEFKRIFGDQECSLAKDKNGYYVTTHRCRSKSYESIDKIPKKDVEFVSSTS